MMDESTNKRIADMLLWMANNKEELIKAINMECHLSLEECHKLVSKMEQDEQYELIIAFLQAGRYSYPVSEINNEYWRVLAAEGWKEIGTHEAISRLKEIILKQGQEEKKLNVSQEDRYS